MPRAIFVSHSEKDEEIAGALVQFLEQTLHLGDGEIFCSSIPGAGIPAGQHFVDYIRHVLADADVIVILLVTGNYLHSVFAVCEMGASWALNRRVIPLLVPPVGYGDLTAVLTGVHVYEATRINDLASMRDQLTGWLPRAGPSTDYAKWEYMVHGFMDRVREVVGRSPVAALEQNDPNDYEVQRALEFYDKIAEHYDRGVSRDFLDTHSELNRVIRGRLTPGKTTNILDLGGGTGQIFSAFDTNPFVAWHYCDACPRMVAVFERTFGGAAALREAVCQDAEGFLQHTKTRFDTIILSFVLSSMPHIINFTLLKHRLRKDGILVVADTNPTYAERKPKFSILDKAANVKYSLRIRPVDAPSLSKNAGVVGFKISDLIGHDKGEQPYSYIATFRNDGDARRPENGTPKRP